MVLGRHHSLLKRLRALRREREVRDREGVLVAEGIHLALDALDARAPIELALVSPRLETKPEGPDLLRRLADAGIEVHETSDDALDRAQDARSPQPVLLVVRRRTRAVEELVTAAAGPALVAVAVQVQDPGNLGGILRSADAAGAVGFAACGGADLYHPRTVRATMGSVFRLPLVAADTAALLRVFRERGLANVAASSDSGQPYDRLDVRRPLALWLGGEGSGLAREVAAELDERVHVPLRAGVDSLSVGAAAAVLLFEIARRRSGITE